MPKEKKTASKSAEQPELRIFDGRLVSRVELYKFVVRSSDEGIPDITVELGTEDGALMRITPYIMIADALFPLMCSMVDKEIAKRAVGLAIARWKEMTRQEE